ncbi:unnamed protein product [Nyctereutes procyonoides]|uniref:(raccoon dog) hypothetical protein n=1 Tax=Nyctereutes procyonoides TaxID=34880 RepID=A0A811YFE4_NYCPR|nr:unnamed protein product [Nyctereutes procyonoides]
MAAATEPGQTTKGKPFKSCYVGVGEFILMTLYLQRNHARGGTKNKILYESTYLDPERKQISNNSSN